MKKLENMRKTTISMIVGILLGMTISHISQQVSVPVTKVPDGKSSQVPPVATKVNVVEEGLQSDIAPGLQIIQVPPPLDINGLHPYQCYLNGQPVNIPKEVIEGLLAKHTDTSDKDPNFNVHNFTGNLKFVGGRTRGVVGE